MSESNKKFLELLQKKNPGVKQKGSKARTPGKAGGYNSKSSPANFAAASMKQDGKTRSKTF